MLLKLRLVRISRASIQTISKARPGKQDSIYRQSRQEKDGVRVGIKMNGTGSLDGDEVNGVNQYSAGEDEEEEYEEEEEEEL